MSQPEHGLYTAEIRLTRACNLSCIHCSVSAGKKGEDELTTSEVENIINQLSDMGSQYLVFTGGEPLLRGDVDVLVRLAVEKGLRVSIDTNGLLLSDERVRALKKAGVSTVQVSLDGLESIHDSIRGSGSFKKAVAGIICSLNEGIYTSVNFTVSRLNQNDLAELIDFAKELGIDSLTMERFTPTGRGDQIKPMIQSPGEFRKSIETLISAKDIRTNSTDPMAIFFKQKTIERYSEEDLATRICGGCTAGIAAITISYDGEVYPCPKLEISCGNIRKDELLDVWLKNQIIRALRSRSLKGSCGSCKFKNLCGGCRAVASAIHGDYMGTDPGCFITEAS
jgi:radical SAM protein with 4Fe4S-binding SPASM domain